MGLNTNLLRSTIPKVMDKLNLSNKEIKRILEKVVNPSRKDWDKHMDDSLWTYITDFKTPLGISPYKLVYGKAFHLPIELKYKAFCAIKKLNFNLKTVGQEIMLQLNELEENRLFSYENVELYIEKTKNNMIRNIRKENWYKDKMFSYLTQD